MKRKPRQIIVNVEGQEEHFLLSTYVSRVFSRNVGSKNPDEAAIAYGANPLETVISMAQIAYNEHPENQGNKLDDQDICFLIDAMELEDCEYEGEIVSKWEMLQKEIFKASFPKPRRILDPNANGELTKETAPQ